MTERTKYPRTYHLPWSPGTTSDDRLLTQAQVDAMFQGREIVITEKMDGENATIYPDSHTHARSMDGQYHHSQSHVKALAGRLAHELPEGWRLCGENMYGLHSILYNRLPSFFLLFGIYTETHCLGWDETVEYARMLGIDTVPVLYRGVWCEEDVRKCLPTTESVFGAPGDVAIQNLPSGVYRFESGMSEGYVVRTVEGFAFDEFASHIAKWVRKGHVQTDEHWKANWRNDPNFVNALGTKFEVGCWIETCHGPAVCTSYDPTKGVSYRYEAQRPGEDESIWVANGDVLSLVTYLRPADEQSRWVLTLRGPYGEGGST